ncbi:MAG: glucosaminidase domain-containing protein [Lachnospiraceae bacterium]|nr:glucosaminidase domain-containing protein [Lachnospiraceae bacterium]
MFKKTYAYLAVTMMLATAAPTLAPAMPALAAAPARAAFDASALTAQDTAYVTSEQTTANRSALSLGKFTTVNGKTYYKTSDGINKKGWIRDAGKWYYFDKGDGHMLTGWVKDDGKWYYLDKKDGHMLTGWLIFKNGRKYYLRRNGSMIQGPCWANVGAKKYRFTANGHVIAAWEFSNGKWYYRNTNGNVVKNRWLYYNGKYYYLTASGATATGSVTIQGKKYSFSKDGDLLGNVPSTVIAAARGSQSTTKKSDSAKSSGAAETNTKTAAAQAVKTTSADSDSSKDSKTDSSKTSGSETSSSSADKTSSAASSASTKTTSSSSSSAASTKTESNKTTAAQKTNTKEITKVVGKLNDLSDSRRLFVIQIANYVRKYAPKYDIKVYSPIIAQAIHESGWGESSLSAKYHNYFGLKCGTLWRGKSVNLSTKEEYSAGTLTTIRSNFRVYDNMEEGVKGYFEFIQLARYANLKGVTSPRQYLQNIKNDGYATGSQYVDHTMALINLYNLTQFDN